MFLRHERPSSCRRNINKRLKIGKIRVVLLVKKAIQDKLKKDYRKELIVNRIRR